MAFLLTSHSSLYSPNPKYFFISFLRTSNLRSTSLSYYLLSTKLKCKPTPVRSSYSDHPQKQLPTTMYSCKPTNSPTKNNKSQNLIPSSVNEWGKKYEPLSKLPSIYPPQFDQDKVNYEKHMQKVKNVSLLLKKLLEEEDLVEGLVMVDAVQRLGLDYHFKSEIDAILQKYFKLITTTTHLHSRDDLYEVSICFRLLRQHGYYVTSDMLMKLIKKKDGKFNSSFRMNVKGLMSLYEATQLFVEGEDILEEAADFANQSLLAILPFLDDHDAKIVRTTLVHPNHKTMPRFLTDNFKYYCQPNCLSELAEIDFKMVQSVQQREMREVVRWWKDLGLAKELKYARNQPLKWHMATMAIITDPSLSEQRIDLTKPISMIYIIDDIFDVYQSLDELTLFTEAVKRWDMDALDKLPDYMKKCLEALNKITNEISDKVYRKHGFNPAYSLQNTWKSLFDAFLVEAKWFASNYLPNTEDYLENGITSSGVHVVLVHLYFLLGNGTSIETSALINNNQGIINHVAAILRLWDDLGSSQDENQDGHDGSYIQCYMKEHKGSSAETAREHVLNLISDSWKRLNKDCFVHNPYSDTFTTYSLNLARMVSIMYNYDENHRLPVFEEHMKSFLSDVDIDR